MSYIDNILGESEGSEMFALTPQGVVKVSSQVVRPGASAAPGNLPSMQPRMGVPAYRAQFDIVITRNTAAIASDLEVVVFNAAGLASGFFDADLNIPAGATLTILGGAAHATPSLYDRIRFSYNIGGDTDTVDVTCRQFAYPSFLDSTKTDLFAVKYMKYFISDSTLLDQYNRRFDYINKSLFGKSENDNVPILANQSARDFRATPIEVPVNFGVDKQKGFIVAIRPTAAFSVTLSMFVDYYNKYDIKNDL